MDIVCVDWRERYTTAFVDQVNEGLQEYGFIRMVGHGVTPELLLAAQEAMYKVVSLPEDVLERYVRRDIHYQRGFAPYGAEGAKDAGEWDLKSFWMTRDPAEPEDPSNNPYGPNIWPEEVPEFKRVMLELFAREYECGAATLSAIETGSGLPRGHLTRLIAGAESMLRGIYYPPLSHFGRIPEGAVRSASHEDINLLTVLASLDLRGLELKVRGKWTPLHTESGEVVIDTGEVIGAMRGVKGYPAMTHQVVNPSPEASDEPRFSFPLFLHLLGDTPLLGELLMRDWLRRRLQEISPT